MPYGGRRRAEQGSQPPTHHCVVELPPETAGSVLKEVLAPRLASPLRGFVLRRTFSVPADAPLADFIAAARSDPVFEIVPARTV